MTLFHTIVLADLLFMGALGMVVLVVLRRSQRVQRRPVLSWSQVLRERNENVQE